MPKSKAVVPLLIHCCSHCEFVFFVHVFLIQYQLSSFFCNYIAEQDSAGCFVFLLPHGCYRLPDKSVYWKIIFFISHPKHMLWVVLYR